MLLFTCLNFLCLFVSLINSCCPLFITRCFPPLTCHVFLRDFRFHLHLALLLTTLYLLTRQSRYTPFLIHQLLPRLVYIPRYPYCQLQYSLVHCFSLLIRRRIDLFISAQQLFLLRISFLLSLQQVFLPFFALIDLPLPSLQPDFSQLLRPFKQSLFLLLCNPH